MIVSTKKAHYKLLNYHCKMKVGLTGTNYLESQFSIVFKPLDCNVKPLQSEAIYTLANSLIIIVDLHL